MKNLSIGIQIAQKNSINLDEQKTITSKIGTLIEEMARTKQIVILVNKYDYPLISNIYRKRETTSCHIQTKKFATPFQAI